MPYSRWFKFGRLCGGNARPLQFERLETRRVLATVTLNTDTGTTGELRSAILDAAPGETIEFNLASGHETIVLDVALGELTIDKSLSIDGSNADGSGASIAIDGGHQVRVLNVDDANADTQAQVTLANLTITGGLADRGAGLRNTESLTLIRATVSGNTATSGSGGGVLLQSATLTVDNSTISENSTTGHGGGIYASNGHLNVVQSTISGNSSDGNGAGIFLYTDAAYQFTPLEGTTSIHRSTLSENRSFGAGGGIYANYFHNLFTMSNSIVGANLSTQIGGDVRDDSSQDSISNNTTLSLITDNSGSGFAEANPVPDANGNLAGGGIGGIIDAQLRPLTDNGGPTPTHLPLSSSPAVDAGDPTIAPGTTTDQRGFERVSDGGLLKIARMDMGSVELGSSPPVVDGDFNDDSLWNCQDINALSAETASMTNDPAFDLTGDTLVNTQDIKAWLVEAGEMNPALTGGHPLLPGDANLDGVVDAEDFIRWNAFRFTTNTNWCDGNFDGDEVVDGADFTVWNQFKFTGSLPATPSTEPVEATLRQPFAVPGESYRQRPQTAPSVVPWTRPTTVTSIRQPDANHSEKRCPAYRDPIDDALGKESL